MPERPCAAGVPDAPRCAVCARPVSRDEIGLSRKLVHRATTVYWCVDCLAARLGATADALRDRARELKDMGCTLF